MSVWEIRIHRVNLVSSETDSFSRSQAAVIPKLLMCATVWTAPAVTHIPRVFWPVVVNLLLSC